ncbi:MAG: ABC transporter permease [Terracidiphilus sp.]|jgi:NitT/TauT family transport system permease protein
MSVYCGKKIKRVVVRGSGIGIFLLLWEIAPRLGWISAQFAPPLSKVLVTIGQLSAEGTLQVHLLVSLWRVGVGLLVSILIAVSLGLVLGGWLTGLAKALDPLLRILGQVNPFSLMPLFMLFFGIGERTKVAVLVWVCVWPILHHTITGVQAIDPALIKSALSMGISRQGLLTRVLLPGAARSIFVGIRVAAGLSFFMLIAAEMIGANAGLGWLMHNAAALYLVPRIYAAGTVIVILGVAINKGLFVLEQRIFFWEGGRGTSHSHAVTKVPRKLGARQLAAFSAILMVALLLGGLQVEKLNARAADVGSYSMHGAHCPMHPEAQGTREGGNVQQEMGGAVDEGARSK